MINAPTRPAAAGAAPPPQKPVRAKRTFTPATLRKTVGNLVASLPAIIRSAFRPRTSRAVREKVMLGVTAIKDVCY